MSTEDLSGDSANGKPVDESELFQLVTQHLRDAGADALWVTIEERRVARGRRLFQLYLRPDLWHAFERALSSVAAVTSFMRASAAPLHLVAPLANRVQVNVEQAIDGFLVGVGATVSNAMRDVMEAELLLRLFAAEPSAVSEWSDADPDTVRRQYSPAAVRQRLERHRGLQGGAQLPDAWEYEVHSQLLHVTPDEATVSLGRPSGTLDDFDHWASEILGHAERFLEAANELFDAMNVPDDRRPTPPPLGPFPVAAPQLPDWVPERTPRTRAERRAAERAMKKSAKRRGQP